jgi:hypothetical protein
MSATLAIYTPPTPQPAQGGGSLAELWNIGPHALAYPEPVAVALEAITEAEDE